LARASSGTTTTRRFPQTSEIDLPIGGPRRRCGEIDFAFLGSRTLRRIVSPLGEEHDRAGSQRYGHDG
jgi:hypothetical protein